MTTIDSPAMGYRLPSSFGEAYTTAKNTCQRVKQEVLDHPKTVLALTVICGAAALAGIAKYTEVSLFGRATAVEPPKTSPLDKWDWKELKSEVKDKGSFYLSNFVGSLSYFFFQAVFLLKREKPSNPSPLDMLKRLTVIETSAYTFGGGLVNKIFNPDFVSYLPTSPVAAGMSFALLNSAFFDYILRFKNPYLPGVLRDGIIPSATHAVGGLFSWFGSRKVPIGGGVFLSPEVTHYIGPLFGSPRRIQGSRDPVQKTLDFSSE